METNSMNSSILDSIGNTPLVPINRLNPNPDVKILAKLEYFNPGGSIKDRIALAMIEAGEKSGQLTHNKTVLEATSGNTGIGLALVCSVKKYKLMLAMSENVSIERRKILKARGAEILLTPERLGTDGAIEEVYRLARENPETYFTADQYNNPANWQAHYFGTAQEIWKQTDGQVSMLVATLGTAGTLMGMSRRLKEYSPDIRIIGVEPYLGHKIQGLKNMKEAYVPEIFEKHRLDEKINIDDEEAFEMTRQLAKQDGLFVGMSSGAAMVIAANMAKKMDSGTIVVIFPDSGERYLSTKLFAVKEKLDIRLFNTMSRGKEPFEPRIPGKVSMYTCGPTVHARMHLGECRRIVFSDLLSRYLSYRGYDVTHIINITDFDDKTINGSNKAGITLSEFTEKYISIFKKDLELLRVKPAQKYPKASGHVPDMITLASRLVQKGFAYEKLRSLYFDISRFSEYGRLSGIDLNKIKLGATVDLDEYEKDNPRDFTLLKRATLSELKRGIFFKSEWGNVRPSWHLQCAAMSLKYLKDNFDIHTAGLEHIFPHHENEIAISYAATGQPLARYWLHSERVLIDGKNIDAKGAGLNLKDLIEMGYTGKEIRAWFLSGHYRKAITFSKVHLKEARSFLKRINTCINLLFQIGPKTEAYPKLDQLLYDLKNGFTRAMDDDLNISRAMASVFKNIKKINILIREHKIDPNGAIKIIDALQKIDSVLQLFDFPDKWSDSEIQSLIKQREQARIEKNWELADNIRDRLKSLGIVVTDQKAVHNF
jgi:cysteinyl-tRNA synthetase